MSTYLPTVFGENLFDVFDDFDRDFFRGFGRPEHVLYGKNASRLMKTDVKETDEGYEVDVDLSNNGRTWQLLINDALTDAILGSLDDALEVFM